LIDGGKLNAVVFAQLFDKKIYSLPIIQKLLANKWLEEKEDCFQLTETGMEMEDAIGPLLFSEQVNQLMQAFELC